MFIPALLLDRLNTRHMLYVDWLFVYVLLNIEYWMLTRFLEAPPPSLNLACCFRSPIYQCRQVYMLNVFIRDAAEIFQLKMVRNYTFSLQSHRVFMIGSVSKQIPNLPYSWEIWCTGNACFPVPLFRPLIQHAFLVCFLYLNQEQGKIQIVQAYTGATSKGSP